MRDLSPKVAADGQGTFHSELLLSQLLILSIVIHTFLKLYTSNKNYMLKNESIFPLCTVTENPPLQCLVEGHFYWFLLFHFIYLFFHPHCNFQFLELIL
jgi:hypothetical protein